MLPEGPGLERRGYAPTVTPVSIGECVRGRRGSKR